MCEIRASRVLGRLYLFVSTFVAVCGERPSVKVNALHVLAIVRRMKENDIACRVVRHPMAVRRAMQCVEVSFQRLDPQEVSTNKQINYLQQMEFLLQ